MSRNIGRKRQAFGMVGLALVVALLAAACASDDNSKSGSGSGSGSGGSSGTPTRGGVYRTATEEFNFTNAFDITGEYLGTAIEHYQALTRTLVNYKHVAGVAGNELFPDLAQDMPEVSSDGLTYTFKLKKGVKFGQPVNREVTSKDVEYAFERVNNKNLAAQYGFYYFGIVKGMDGKAASSQPISGIETPDDATIVFHLTEPTGDFLYRLSMPATAPIPKEVAKCFDEKAGDYGRYLISSGPYQLAGSDKLDVSSCDTMRPIAGFDPTRKLNMVRNPNYDQAADDLRANYVDGISVTLNSNTADVFNRVESGSLDGSLDSKPPRTTLLKYTQDAAKK
ncbi:MAG: ABC transporter substrate-binding protein, partial [Sporichthyaceae bacterium]|nr:ABC transporter substrate-binding protein [Sporichthyaceae bacterium]